MPDDTIISLNVTPSEASPEGSNENLSQATLFSLLTETAVPGTLFFSKGKYHLPITDRALVAQLRPEKCKELAPGVYEVKVSPTKAFFVRDARNSSGVSFQVFNCSHAKGGQGRVYISQKAKPGGIPKKVIKRVNDIPDEQRSERFHAVILEWLANLRYQFYLPTPRLTHLNWYYNFDTKRIIPFLTIPLCPGKNLHDCLTAEREFSAKNRLIAAIRMCQELRRFHMTGMVDADLSPQNTMFDDSIEYGSLRLVDFGFSLHNAERRTLKGRVPFIDRALIQQHLGSRDTLEHRQHHEFYSLLINLFCLLSPTKEYQEKSRSKMNDSSELIRAYSENFFKTHCLPSILEHPVFKDLLGTYKKRNFRAQLSELEKLKAPISQKIRLILKYLLNLYGEITINDKETKEVFNQLLNLSLSDIDSKKVLVNAQSALANFNRLDSANQRLLLEIFCQLLDDDSLEQLQQHFEVSPYQEDVNTIQDELSRRAPVFHINAERAAAKKLAFIHSLSKAEAMLTDPVAFMVLDQKRHWLHELKKSLDATYWQFLQTDDSADAIIDDLRRDINEIAFNRLTDEQIADRYKYFKTKLKALKAIPHDARMASPLKAALFSLGDHLLKKVEILDNYEVPVTQPEPKQRPSRITKRK